jgi:hypothetical protein
MSSATLKRERIRGIILRMSGPKFLKCDCAHCGGHIAFPAEGIGSVIACPHCGADTELVLPEPEVESTGLSRNVKWAIAAAAILVLGVAGIFVALSMARKIAHRPNIAAADPRSVAARPEHSAQASWLDHTNQFQSSAVTVKAQPGTTLVYASGTIQNGLDTQRFGVTVELELLDAAGAPVGKAQDYRAVLEPGAEWTYRALVVSDKAASARVTSIREER